MDGKRVVCFNSKMNRGSNQMQFCGQHLFMVISPEQAEALQHVLRLLEDHPTDCYCCKSRTVPSNGIAALGGLYRLAATGLDGAMHFMSPHRTVPSKAQRLYTPTSAQSSSATSPSARTRGPLHASPSGSSPNQCASALNIQGSSPNLPSTGSQRNQSWIVFGFQCSSELDEIENIEISDSVNDPLFFRELRARHNKHRWFFQRCFSPLRFRNCKFVRVSVIVNA
jgi:hypothetical protein